MGHCGWTLSKVSTWTTSSQSIEVNELVESWASSDMSDIKNRNLACVNLSNLKFEQICNRATGVSTRSFFLNRLVTNLYKEFLWEFLQTFRLSVRFMTRIDRMSSPLPSSSMPCSRCWLKIQEMVCVRSILVTSVPGLQSRRWSRVLDHPNPKKKNRWKKTSIRTIL